MDSLVNSIFILSPSAGAVHGILHQAVPARGRNFARSCMARARRSSLSQSAFTSLIYDLI